jgi:L-asparaginase II
MNYEPVAEVYRGKNLDGTLQNPQLESTHFGIISVIDEQDRILFSRGNVQFKTYIRSAAKPIQVLPLLESGGVEHFGFTPRESAVLCASHNGEPVHVQTVQNILEKIGLNESYLQCGAHAPSHGPSAEDLIRNGIRFSALHNNCSGKHAGMLAACIRKGYPVENYLAFDHPLQREILTFIETFSGARDVFRGTDGCSAPVFLLEIQQMARLFALLASQKHELLKLSFAIMRADPYMIGGAKRFDTDLMLNSGVIGKVGGEGVHCVGIPADDNRPAIGIAVKIADGNFRALYPVVISLLKKMGALNDQQLQNLSYYARTPLTNHNKKEIGYIQSVEF